jgi:hypothetical protein
MRLFGYEPRAEFEDSAPKSLRLAEVSIAVADPRELRDIARFLLEVADSFEAHGDAGWGVHDVDPSQRHQFDGERPDLVVVRV